MKTIPDHSFGKLWNISFGFFGVQIAYALQSANISRIFSTIFSTLGADPHELSYFWLLPPLAGIIVQPIIGAASDKTWTRWGRRIPYLFLGATLALIVMCLLPNAGSFGFTVAQAMIFGLFALMLLDTMRNRRASPTPSKAFFVMPVVWLDIYSRLSLPGLALATLPQKVSYPIR